MTQGQRAMAVLRAADIRIDRRALALRLVRHCLENKAELADVVAKALRSYLDGFHSTAVVSTVPADEEPDLLH